MRMSRHAALCSVGGFTSADFTYTGTHTWVDDGNGNFRIKFLTSGTFTPRKTLYFDVFLVGGGGGTVYPTDGYLYGCGGAGYTRTYVNIQLIAGTAYQIVVGAGGGNWANGGKSWFSNIDTYYANGGYCGGQYPAHQAHVQLGGNGSSGGCALAGGNYGGTDGGDGSHIVYGQYYCYGGVGQHSTTREFGDSSGDMYARGGGASTPITANTGNGARDCYGSANGCSGICVIRNHRAA